MNECPWFPNTQGKVHLPEKYLLTFEIILRDFNCRGENLMGCWAMRESKSNPNSCTFDWIMCLDLKGRFPRFVLDKVSHIF